MNEANESSPPTHIRAGQVGLVIVIAVYVLLAITTSQTMHFSRALDEGYHLEYVAFIKENGRLPISYDERSTITRADFPPLYHLLVSAVSSGVEVGDTPDFKLFWDSFRYRAIDHQNDAVWTLDTEDLTPPYVGRFLVWQIGRWTSIALSALTLIIVYVALSLLPLPQQPWSALAGTALLAFIPRYLLLGSSLNDDNLLGPVAALYFLMLILAIKGPHRWWPWLGLGITLGLSMTVKYTLVLMPLEIAAILLLLARHYNLSWGWVGQRLLATGGVAALASSWWFGWNVWFLNTVAQDGWYVGLLRPLTAGGNDQTLNRLGGLFSEGEVGQTELAEGIIIGTFPEFVQRLFLSFWSRPLMADTPLAELFVPIVIVLLIIVVFGLWRVWQSDRPNRMWLSLLLTHVALFIVLPLIRFNLTRRLSVAAQGRHILIPAAIAVAALLVWGLLRALPQRWQRTSLGAVVAVLLIWCGAHIVQLNSERPAYLPLRTNAQAAAWLAEPINAQFGEGVELVSFEYTVDAAAGALDLELAWRSIDHVNESYRSLITIRDADGQSVSHWTGYHANGRLPTLSWDPGDVVFDRLRLPLPGLPVDTYSIHIELFDRNGRLAVSHPDAVGDVLTVATLELSQPTADLVPRDDSLLVWRVDGLIDPTQRPQFRYPATVTIVSSADQLTYVAPTAQKGELLTTPDHVTGQVRSFVIGPAWSSGDYSLVVFNDAGQPLYEATDLFAVDNWQPRTFTPPEIETPLEANFAGQLQLLGYKLPDATVQAGEAFPLTLYWQAIPGASPQASFTQFNTLLDGNGQPRGGYERKPLEYYDTLLWAPGEVVVDGYAIPVDADAPPGQYFLNVGYYLTVGESAVNLPLVIDGEMSNITSVSIGPIEVVAP